MKLFVFDFHGVLEKGAEKAVLYYSNEALRRLGFPQRFTQEQINSFYGMKWYEYFEKLVPGLNQEDYKTLHKKCIEIQTENPLIITKNMKATDYSCELLEKIVLAGHDMILISNTNPDSMNIFLNCTGHNASFEKDKIFAVESHNGKNNVLKKYLEEQVISYDSIVIIGDSPSDMLLKTVCPNNSKTYLYTHPHLKERECNSDFKIRDLRALLCEVETCQ